MDGQKSASEPGGQVESQEHSHWEKRMEAWLKIKLLIEILLNYHKSVYFKIISGTHEMSYQISPIF